MIYIIAYIFNEFREIKNEEADNDSQQSAADNVARVMFAEVGARVSDNQSPKEDEQGEDGLLVLTAGTLKGEAAFPQGFAISQAEEQG